MAAFKRMNYCLFSYPTTERCECYSFYDKFHEPEVYKICDVNQACVSILTENAKYVYECLNACQAGKPGPCYNLMANGGATLIKNDQVGLQLNANNTDLTYFPIAQLDMFLIKQSACLQKAGDTPEWVVCEPGQYCGKLSETTAKCANLCPKASIAPQECLCRAENGTNVLAQPGQFCADDGSVSEFTDQICKLNSFGNGTCRCEAGQAACQATSVCVTDKNTTITCMPACKLNGDNKSGADCACRGQTNTQIVPADGKCVIQSDGTAALQTLKICDPYQIGPCACQIAVSPAPAQYVYTDAFSACYYPYTGSAQTVAPLMPVGSLAVDEHPCQNAVKNPTSSGKCQVGHYCMTADATDNECLLPCLKDFVAEGDCACQQPDGKTAKLANRADFCSASGEVVKRQSDLCHSSANVVEKCKCSESDQTQCTEKQYCSAQNGIQTCVRMCNGIHDALSHNCVCAHSGSDALVPEGSVCVCASISQQQACTAVIKCESGQIGPCGAEIASKPSYVNSESAFIQTRFRIAALLLCKPNVVANQECACEDGEILGEMPRKATAMEPSKGCMHRLNGTTAVVRECALGNVSGSACACRILKDMGGASHCDVGSVCMINPDDSDKQICWRLCSDDGQCSSGKKCIGTGANAHCEFTCAAHCNACIDAPEFCTECATGYYLVGVKVFQTCAKCQASCATCTSATTCTKCADGYEQTNTDPDQLVCEKIVCDANCDICDTTTSCKTCKTGYITTGQANKKTCMPDCLTAVPQCVTCKSTTACQVCNPGYESDTCSKIACADITECTLCKSSTECINCNPGYEGDKCTKVTCDTSVPNCELCSATDNKICVSCKDGYINSVTQCTTGGSCPVSVPNCSRCSDGKEVCYECKNGYQNPGAKCVEMTCSDSVKNCVSCTQPNGTTCKKCETGFTGTACDSCDTGYTGEKCDTCIDGYYQTGAPNAKTCTECQMQCATCISAETCLTCKPAFTGKDCLQCATGYEGSLCDECAEGYMPGSVEGTCVKKCQVNQDGCETCASDKCTKCLGGFYGEGEPNALTCIQCLTNCTACTSATACQTCTTGYSGDKCDTCSDGYKQTSTDPAPLVCTKINCSGAAPNCATCESEVKCKVCNNGFAGQQCDTCAVGFAGNKCDQCSSGYQQTSSGSDPLVCTKITCDGKSNCTLCSTTGCLACEDDYGLTGAAGSQTCNQKATCSNGAGNCTTCKDKYDCDKCAEGYDPKGAAGFVACEKILCGDNCKVCATASSCKTCNTDYTTTGAPDAQTCVLDCPTLIPNCAECSSKTECTKCDTGFTGGKCNTCDTGYAGSNCANCAEGYEKKGNPATCQKITCDPECSVCLASDNCKECKPGFTTTGEENEKTCMIDCLTAIPQCRKCTTTTECGRCNTGYKNPATDCVEMMCAAGVKDCTSCTEPNGLKCAVCSKDGAKPDKNGVCKSGLTGGAIAGIVIAVLVVVAGVCCCVYFFMKKQQSAKKQQQNDNNNDQDTEENKNDNKAAVAVDFGAE